MCSSPPLLEKYFIRITLKTYVILCLVQHTVNLVCKAMNIFMSFSNKNNEKVYPSIRFHRTFSLCLDLQTHPHINEGYIH